jgi:hypothetical protein
MGDWKSLLHETLLAYVGFKSITIGSLTSEADVKLWEAMNEESCSC